MVRKQNGNLWRKLRERVLKEEDYCRICGYWVDKSRKTPDPWSPEVDHILPLARGGAEYDRSNLGLTHRRCNGRKGAGRGKRSNIPSRVPPPTRPKDSDAW